MKVPSLRAICYPVSWDHPSSCRLNHFNLTDPTPPPLPQVLASWLQGADPCTKQTSLIGLLVQVPPGGLFSCIDFCKAKDLAGASLSWMSSLFLSLCIGQRVEKAQRVGSGWCNYILLLGGARF